MAFLKLEELVDLQQSKIVLFYAPPGTGKSTMLGLIAEKSEGITLVLDVDRTITQTLAKKETVKDISKISVRQIDISTRGISREKIGTWCDWELALAELATLKARGKLNVENICVDNISELERCLLSDLGSQGKNDGVPSQGDYQKVQFKIVNSIRLLKQLGVNVYMTAWEVTEQFTQPDGNQYSRLYPKISMKIVDNVCGLCDVVAKMSINSEGKRGLILDATKNIYAKNQINNIKACKVEEF